MPHLVWARRASAEPMGQERYEQAACDAIRASTPAGWDIEEIVVRSLRSTVPGRRRLPARLERAPQRVQRLLGRSPIRNLTWCTAGTSGFRRVVATCSRCTTWRS